MAALSKSFLGCFGLFTYLVINQTYFSNFEVKNPFDENIVFLKEISVVFSMGECEMVERPNTGVHVVPHHLMYKAKLRFHLI